MDAVLTSLEGKVGEINADLRIKASRFDKSRNRSALPCGCW